MVKLQITHIKRKLNETFKGLMDLSDSQHKPEAEREKVFLSRSYAAYSLMSLASAEPRFSITIVTY